MPLVQEITSSIHGGWRLVLRDADGMRWFNLSVEGFWRSFIAAFLILPLALLIAQVPLPQEDPGVERGLVLVVGLYLLEWVGRAIILLGLSAIVGRTQRYAALVIVWNWVAIPEFGLFAVATIVAFLLPPMAPFVFVIALGLMFAIDYFATRTALDVGAGPGFGIVLVIFLAQLALGLATTPTPVPA